jgi:hypothetical protein
MDMLTDIEFKAIIKRQNLLFKINKITKTRWPLDIDNTKDWKIKELKYTLYEERYCRSFRKRDRG